jgi:hypothetical protein
MVRDGKINLKLEVYKDKNSGRLFLMAHFDNNAPNIYKEKDDFLWLPTIEEKDFINEAFKMVPDESIVPSSDENISKPEETKEIKRLLETSKEINTCSETEKPKEISHSSELHSPTEEIKATEKSIDEEFERSSIVSESNEEIKNRENLKDFKSKDIASDNNKQIAEEPNDDELDNMEKEQDRALIVEADAEAIDQALKKHGKKGESIVEADEQTIIDKVLSQKKKGKWDKK